MDMTWANGLLSAAGVSRAVVPRDVSHVTANDPDPMGGGWEEKIRYVDSTADGVRDTARGSN